MMAVNILYLLLQLVPTYAEQLRFFLCLKFLSTLYVWFPEINSSVFTPVPHWSLSRAKWIQETQSHSSVSSISVFFVVYVFEIVCPFLRSSQSKFGVHFSHVPSVLPARHVKSQMNFIPSMTGEGHKSRTSFVFRDKYVAHPCPSTLNVYSFLNFWCQVSHPYKRKLYIYVGSVCDNKFTDKIKGGKFEITWSHCGWALILS